MRLLALVLLLATADRLGPPVRQDGFQLRPPRGFHMARMDLFHGTRVGGIASRSDTPRYVAAVLLDGESEAAASITLSMVETSFTLGPTSRDELATSVVRHFRDELGLKLELERAEVRQGATPRVEVLGSVREGSQLRTVLVAAWPQEAQHVVALISVPSGRWDELRDVVHESLDSYRADPRLGSGPAPQWAWAFAALVGAGLATSVGLWRRRQARRRSDAR